jgi:polysaccharide biosynthesis/export protein
MFTGGLPWFWLNSCMKKGNSGINILIVLLMLVSFGCIPQKNVIYFQGAQPKSLPDSLRYFTNQDYEFVIAPYDLLSIQIDGIDSKSYEVFAPVNRGVGVGGGGGATGAGSYLRGNLVDKFGQVELPYVGKIKLSGLTLMQAGDTIRSKLAVYMADPALVNVDVKIMNFTVSVIGEIGSPGVVQASNEFITLTEVLAKAGGLTTFSNRKNIKLIRSDRETKETTVYMIDLTKADLIQPIIARLQPNDVIYVESIRRKQISTIGPIIGLVTTAVTFPLLILNLIDRFNRP